MARHAGYGLIGCGSFGQFCLEQYKTLDDVHLLAVTDVNSALASEVAGRFGMTACASVEELLGRSDVQIVHIATPPGTHHDLVMNALRAGKHVLCEKPLATSAADAKSMLDAAAKAKRVLVVNLIMRYDPLCLATKQIIGERLLGEPIHAFFENYAQDQRLPPEHWFWKRELSGGIFVEHGVHFFDLFESWLGPGQVLRAVQMSRPGAPQIIDQVECLCRHGDNVLTSFYHGFHQPDRLDRQEFRIVCERGDIRLFEWLPTAMRIDAILLDREVEPIMKHLTALNGRVQETARYRGDERRVSSHHKNYEVDGRFLIEADAGIPKMQLYGKVLRDLLADQVRAIFDPSHRRILDEQAGLRTIEMADAATKLAFGSS